MVRLMTGFIVLHIFEILLWAASYRWLCFPLWESAFYFSTSSYATVGYGDIALPQMWRSLGPVESASSTGRRNTCVKFTRGSLEAQSFSGTLI
jgi:Ion channel